MTLVTIYQANNPETLPVNLATPEIVLESELPDRLQHTTGITYEGDDRDGYYTRINQRYLLLEIFHPLISPQ